MCTFCYLSPISAMPLPQTNCNKIFFFSSYFGNAIATNSFPQVFFFFFSQFRQWYCQKPTEINFFPSYLAMSLPQFHFTFFFFVIEERDKPNCFSKKKYWKNKNMRTFFYISHLFQQCHCHKQQIFFYYVLFFCFCSQHFRIRILYLCSEYFFFFFLHHFRIRILYLSLQRVSCTWFFSLISAMPLPQLICHKFFWTNNN